ncbi:MAG: FG-GAP and VCBS repeat-containing protein [Chloroflexota bacterium]
MKTIRTALVVLVGVALATGFMAVRPAQTVAITVPARQSDFNGDGYADLAVTAPGDHTRRGGVSVLYGSSSGLTALGDQRWWEGTPGLVPIIDTVPPRAYQFDRVATGDFDSDGYADLAVGSAYHDAEFGRDVDTLRLIRGSRSGLTTAGNKVWKVTDLPEAGPDRFYLTGGMTTGDFDGDGYADLAFSSPLYDANFLGQGSVGIMFGGRAGLDPSTTRFVVAGSPGDGALFGPLASGDLDADGRDDLIAGSEGARIAGALTGAVYVYRGRGDRLIGQDADMWSEARAAVPGNPVGYDGFGHELAVGDFDRDGFDDVAIGAPYKRIVFEAAGAVVTLRGSRAGLTAGGARVWHQGVRGIPGTPERGDTFGYTLATGDFDGDGAHDLAIGAPTELVGTKGCGTVTTLYGTRGGLTATRAKSWSQDSSGVPGVVEICDTFGAALVSANFGKSRRDDLAIGVSRESIGKIYQAGMVNVLYGTLSGLTGTGSQGWSQDSPGIKGAAGEDDRFGAALAH